MPRLIVQRNLLVLLLLLALYILEPRLFRKKYKSRVPIISSIQLALNDAAQFTGLSGYSFAIFNERIVAYIKPVLHHTRESINEWLNSGAEHILWRPRGNKHPKHSPSDRILMTLMILRNFSIKSLEILWGMTRSGIYDTAWLVCRVILKVKGNQLMLPRVGSDEYEELVGMGVFEDVFDTAVFSMDGKEIVISQPPVSQREFYDGRKGAHCMNFLTVHDGDGLVHGGEPGSINDVTLLHRSSFYRFIHDYVDIERDHCVICDGIWRYEGVPFLTRFCERDDTELTVAERIFNYNLSQTRVMDENYYAREVALFPILNHFKWRLDKLHVVFRVCCILTNEHIKYISPLR